MRTFSDLWNAVAATGRLPGMAILDMPKVIEEETKNALAASDMAADEVADLLVKVIDTINAGSVERVDILVRARLRDIGIMVDGR